ncbi:calcium-binding protein [Pseudoprimorskyibacter insulae]|uniref:Leukotoxin n=1 Tax=Pseudoprimorskyibacter insulae TaxID=1695997 RepID=A0A2R8AQZ4_9RHOB|nr:calcium-binding protein [Pseudoprimorskyibacter insulae]SPF78506.1 Leukotoxin [Pseudoprimorskyibacter insulae]
MSVYVFDRLMTVIGTEGDDSLTAGNYYEYIEGNYYTGLWGKGGNDSFYVTMPTDSNAHHVQIYADIASEGMAGDADAVYLDFSASNLDLVLTTPRSQDDSRFNTFAYLVDPDGGASQKEVMGNAIEHVYAIGGSGNDQFAFNINKGSFDGGAGTDGFSFTMLRTTDPQTGELIRSPFSLHLDMAQAATAAGVTLPNGTKLANIEYAKNLSMGTLDDWFSDYGQNNDFVAGWEGDDTIRSSGGKDTIYGHDGTDTAIVDWSWTSDQVNLYRLGGQDGWITMWIGPSASPDNLMGPYYDAANSVSMQNFENFQIMAGSGSDSLEGTDTADAWDGGAGDDTLTGGLGNDTLTGGAGDDLLQGGADDDRLIGGDGADTLQGDDGVDTAVFDFAAPSNTDVTMDSENIYLTSGGVTDTVARTVEFFEFSDGTLTQQQVIALTAAAATGAVVVTGTPVEGQTLTADTSGVADANGVGSYSYQWMRDGVDIPGEISDTYGVITGDIGTAISVRVSFVDGIGTLETLTSAATADVQAQALTLTGTPGADYLVGGQAGDTLNGLDGVDTLIGNGGDDLLIGGESENDLRDVIYGGDGNDSALGGYGNDELRGDAGNDTLEGGYGADTVIGGTGNDVLTAGAWGDALFGGAGDDFINGGFGFDRVNGGSGADKFYHQGVIGHGDDWIQDYSAADGDVLMFGGGAATRDDFLVQRASTAGAGDATVQEVFVTYIPTADILWALIDGDGQSQINVLAAGQVFDLLA